MRKRPARRTEHNVSVRLSKEEFANLERWADADPHDGGLSAQLRRLINEEVERERHPAANRAG